MKNKITALFILVALPFSLLQGQGVSSDTAHYLSGGSWDDHSLWGFSAGSGASGNADNYSGLNGDGISLSYTFPSGGGWVNLEKSLGAYSTADPIVFFIYSATDLNYLELKFTDSDGSVFGIKKALSNYYNGWTHICIYLDNTEYWWGGNTSFGTPSKFSVALSGTAEGSGAVILDETGIGKAGLPTTFLSTIDPNALLPGTGFLQRRDEALTPPDPLVLEYLKVLQDESSPAGQLLPSLKGGTEAQTFNNSLGALAFIVSGERERAERILDFYQSATDSANTDLKKQNFFYNGEARGFYQQFILSTGRDGGSADRWIGDMAWLLIAAKNYEAAFSSDRYDYLITLIYDLFIAYYKPAVSGGYIQSGWRKGDSYLHETSGHHEGNIDCYVVMKLCGDDYLANKIKTWVDSELSGRSSLPLDLYTWRVLAFGATDPSYPPLLNIPEYDFRYRKILNVNGEEVMGMFSNPDIEVNNFWNDGTGHISCAFQAFGDVQRGYFYANQMDKLLIEETVGTTLTRTVPYTLNHAGGYEWADTSAGFVSCAAWYLLAKNGCNPFMSGSFTEKDYTYRQSETAFPELRIWPNPFGGELNISYRLPSPGRVRISLEDTAGRTVGLLSDMMMSGGGHTSLFRPGSSQGAALSPGLYLLRLETDDEVRVSPVIHLAE
ncbi:MAG: hypothetical protein ACOYXB_14135 [Bacteroidota bacterium]